MRILNFGSMNIDCVYRVEHFVRPGETLSARSVTRNAGGKGFNQSVALAKAGCEVYHAGHIGSDGTFLADLCREYGVNTEFLTQVDVPTGSAIIQVDDDGGNCILLSAGANFAVDLSFVQEVLSHFGSGDLIVLQNEISCMNEIMQLADQAGMRIAINPAPMNDAISQESLALAEWIIVNETEAYELTGEKELQRQLSALKERFPKASSLVTLGEHGAVYQTADQLYSIGTCKVDAVDTTAAGDTFTGFFLSTLVETNDPQLALLTATKASALAVTRSGAAKSIPTLEEVRACEFAPAAIA
ncbi:MAG: ribokinase [Clostridiales bacterium]|nr:ribokinase [Clostridiales bacterium]